MSSQQHQQEPPTDEKSGPAEGRKEQQLLGRADLQLVRRAWPKDQQGPGRGPGRGPGQGPGRSQVQDERRYGRHELCGQHGRQEPCHHDRVGHRRPLEQDHSDERLDVMCVCSVKKGKPVLRKKVMSVVVICQREV